MAEVLKNPMDLADRAKNLFQARSVIPAEAGIQSFQGILDSRFRGSDASGLKVLSNLEV